MMDYILCQLMPFDQFDRIWFLSHKLTEIRLMPNKERCVNILQLSLSVATVWFNNVHVDICELNIVISAWTSNYIHIKSRMKLQIHTLTSIAV